MSHQPNLKKTTAAVQQPRRSSIPIKMVKNGVLSKISTPKNNNDEITSYINSNASEPHKLSSASSVQGPTELKMKRIPKLLVKSIPKDIKNNNEDQNKIKIMETPPDENGNSILVSDEDEDLSITKNNENLLNKTQIDSPAEEDEGSSLLSSIICDAADGNLVTNTLSNILDCIDSIVQNVTMTSTDLTKNDPQVVDQSGGGGGGQPKQPVDIFDVNERIAQKIFSYLPLADKKNIRIVCRRWKFYIEDSQLTFQVNLTQATLQKLQSWTLSTPLDKMVAFDLLEVDLEELKNLGFLYDSLKELQVESMRVEDHPNESKTHHQNSTIGEKNLIELLKLCGHLQSLHFEAESIGNFGLEVIPLNKVSNQMVVGWQWPEIKVQDKVTAVSTFFGKILGDLESALNYHDSDDLLVPPGQVMIPSDPPVLDIKYQDNPPPPSIPLFTSLTAVQLDELRELSMTVQPTKNKEKLGLIALLHVLTFPSLRTFSLSCQEFIPDEDLYGSIFKFIIKHKSTLRFLTFINPVLSTKINTSPMLFHLSGLEKVKLRELTVAWDLAIGLDICWSNGHYLLEVQRRLQKLEFHSKNVVRVESVICNNFRYLTTANIDVTDTKDTQFDCSCFSLCGKLKTLVLRVPLTVQMKNVTKIPDTLQCLHWDAMYTREEVCWFSHFLILATSIYLYHDKDVLMDIVTPFTLTDFIHFIRLPYLEQLYLPRIQVHDPRVTQFCHIYNQHFNHNKRWVGGGGLRQEKDLFFIDRKIFTFNEALINETRPVNEWTSSSTSIVTSSDDDVD